MKTFRAPLISAAVLAMTSGATSAQVRVITPDSEHVYSSDPARPQQLPDDEALQLQNERAERARIARERETDRQEICAPPGATGPGVCSKKISTADERLEESERLSTAKERVG